MAPVLDVITREAGRSTAVIALELSRRGIRKPRGSTIWTPADVRRLQRRPRLGA